MDYTTVSAVQSRHGVSIYFTHNILLHYNISWLNQYSGKET